MTQTLVQFLCDRLDEDERAAMQSIEQATVHLAGADAASVSAWHVVERPTGTFVATRDQWDRVAEVVPNYGGAHTDHIARHDPARVLAEVDAKRRILAEVYPEVAKAEELIQEEWHSGGNADGDLLRLLALPYADHPDYRQEWRP